MTGTPTDADDTDVPTTVVMCIDCRAVPGDATPGETCPYCGGTFHAYRAATGWVLAELGTVTALRDSLVTADLALLEERPDDARAAVDEALGHLTAVVDDTAVDIEAATDDGDDTADGGPA